MFCKKPLHENNCNKNTTLLKRKSNKQIIRKHVAKHNHLRDNNSRNAHEKLFRYGLVE